MKKITFKTLAAVLGCTTLLFTGCLNNFEGTTPKYEEYSENYTSRYGENWVADGLVSSNINFSKTGNKAAQDTTVEIIFNNCKSALDEASVDAAVSFYKLKPNAANQYYYPEHDGDLVKTFIRKEEPSYYNGTVRYIYNVNTENITYDKIALVIDGSKLKYTNGMAVLSNDKNITAGEVTDTVVKYLTMVYKKDGTTPLTNILNIFDERYDAKYHLGLNTDLTFNADFTYQTPQPSGSNKTRYLVRAPVKELNADTSAKSYVDNLSSVLSQMYKLQIQKPGSTEWEASGTLTFTWHSTASSAAADPYSANTYTTDIDTSTLEKGTKYRVIRDDSVSLGTPPAWIKAAYGHEPMPYTLNRSIVVRTGYISYASTDTPYIFEWDGYGSFSSASDCTYDNAQAAQSSMFNCTYDSSSIILTPVSGVKLKDVNGFILVSPAKGIIESTTILYYDENGAINKVRVKTKDNSYIGSVKIYVNNKTTIESNTYNTKQLTFGCYPDTAQGELSGYVEIGEGLFTQGEPVITDTAGSTDINDYTLAYVDRNNGNNIESVFEIYMLPGTYYIQKANRLSDDYNILSSVSGVVYYGALQIINNKTNAIKLSMSSGSSTDTFTISENEAGYYKVRCYSFYSTTSNDTYHYYDGYMAFHIYKN
ncbi:MAG: hypothetical protein IK102_09865 [Treponema sp.]|nr:hypothetical protein [Treponema sp.]